jgi:hypothetical protein
VQGGKEKFLPNFFEMKFGTSESIRRKNKLVGGPKFCLALRMGGGHFELRKWKFGLPPQLNNELRKLPYIYVFGGTKICSI